MESAPRDGRTAPAPCSRHRRLAAPFERLAGRDPRLFQRTNGCGPGWYSVEREDSEFGSVMEIELVPDRWMKIAALGVGGSPAARHLWVEAPRAQDGGATCAEAQVLLGTTSLHLHEPAARMTYGDLTENDDRVDAQDARGMANWLQPSRAEKAIRTSTFRRHEDICNIARRTLDTTRALDHANADRVERRLEEHFIRAARFGNEPHNPHKSNSDQNCSAVGDPGRMGGCSPEGSLSQIGLAAAFGHHSRLVRSDYRSERFIGSLQRLLA